MQKYCSLSSLSLTRVRVHFAARIKGRTEQDKVTSRSPSLDMPDTSRRTMLLPSQSLHDMSMQSRSQYPHFHPTHLVKPTATVTLLMSLVLCAMVGSSDARSPSVGTPLNASSPVLFAPAAVDTGLTSGVVRAVGRVSKGAGPLIVAEHPWERSFCFYHSVISVGDELWLYYSSWTEHGAYVCLARSSDDGASFSKPVVGTVE